MEIYLYNTNTGTQASENIVRIEDYVNQNNLNEWQKFNIPMDDFGLVQDFDAIR